MIGRMTKKFLVALALVIGMVEGLCYAFTVIPGADQMQMLEKAVRLAVFGKWVHWGNVVTGGGSNPGSLSTALVGLPLMIWDSPWSFEILISALHLLSLLLMYRALDKDFSERERVAFLLLAWLTPWRTSNTFLWNPSYLFFPAGLHFYTAQRSSEQPRFWMSYFHVLAIGFALQMHQSFLILLISSFYLLVRRQVRVQWWGLLCGVATVTASMIPYFLALRVHKQLAPIVNGVDTQFYYGRGLVEVYPLLKGLFYWPRFTSGLFPVDIFSLVDFNWIADLNLRALASGGFTGLKYSFGVLTLALSLAAMVWFFRKLYAAPQFLLPSFVDNFTVATLIAIFVSSAISPIVFSNWHLMLAMPIAYMNFVKFLSRGVESFAWARKLRLRNGSLIAPLCIYFVIYGAIGVFASQTHSFTSNIHTRYLELKQLCIEKSLSLDRTTNQ